MARTLLSALLPLLLLACESERVPLERAQPPRAGSERLAGTPGIHAGPPMAEPRFVNPFEGNSHAVQQGKQYYAWFNCDGCHGAIGGGSMGPPLRDHDWIYGGSSLQIYQSIVDGRPGGMPSFRGRIPEDALWKLVAFVRTFPGAPAAPPADGGAPGDEEAQHDPTLRGASVGR